MGIFGWRLTNKKPQVESDQVKELHEKLDTEQRFRDEEKKLEAKKLKEREIELKTLKRAEAERIKKQQRNNKKAAISHLKMAERYYDSMTRAKGSRKSELRAIIDKRIEQAANLGFQLNGTITNTIERLS